MTTNYVPIIINITFTLMKNIAIYAASIALTGMASCSTPKDDARQLSVMPLTGWMEATNVENGFSAVVAEIARLSPDIVMLSEAHSAPDRFYIPALIDSLAARGLTYYGQESQLDVQLIARHPVVDQATVVDQQNGAMRTRLDVDGSTVVAYTGHLDYTHYECYMPRGYSGTTWQKIDAPITDTDSVMAANDASMRDDEIRAIIEDAAKQEADMIILGGDFNEPSHLDWSEDTKNLFDHNGAVIPWSCSSLLYEAGFRDAYREKNPDPVTHPGFTFPSDNPEMPTERLTWAPEADERDRIDFIYYLPSEIWSVGEAIVLGPRGSIVRNERKPELTSDSILTPLGTWPSDHKGVLVKFKKVL